MELTHLRSFLQVAHTGSASRAADLLMVSQPAVTQHIRALEGELKVRLFDRTGRGLALTATGRTLRDYAQRSLSLLEESRQAVLDMEAGTVGTLLIGAGVTTSIFFLPARLSAFRRQYPAIDVLVRTGHSKGIAEMVLDRQIDLGLVTSSSRHQELRRMELFREQIILVSQAADPLSGKPIRLQHLPALPLILFPRPSGFRDYVDRTLAAAGITLHVKMELDSVEAIKSFVAVGLGASFLPRSAVQADLDAGLLSEIRIIGAPRLERATTLIHRRDRYLAAPQRAFMAMVQT